MSSAPLPRPGGDLVQAGYMDLRRYLTALRLNRRLLILVTVLVLLLSAVYSFTRTNQYTATAKVRVKPILFNPADARVTDPTKSVTMPVEAVVVKSNAVADLARKNLASSLAKEKLAYTGTAQQLLPHVHVNVPQESLILEISFTAPVPKVAQAGATAFAAAYLKSRSDEAVKTKQNQEDPLVVSIAKVADSLNGKLSPFERVIAQTKVDYLNTQLQAIALETTDPGNVLLSATLPTSPSSPNHPLDLGLGLVFGLALGVALAFFRTQTDARLRDRNQLEDAIGSPVLATIPQDVAWMDRGTPRLVTVLEPRSQVAESYRALRTTVLAAAAKHDVRTIMVTSALAGEGKTTTAANLAVVMAQADRRVALIGADLRKPRLHQFFGLANERGLSDILQGVLPARESLKRTPVPNLWILSGGSEPEHPAELLQSKAMEDFLEEQREVMDFVILDCTPVLAVADGLGLVPFIDAVLFVADTSISRLDAIEAATVQLTQMGAPVLGAVLNDFDVTSTAHYGYGYGYGSGYGPPRTHRSSDIGGNGAREGKIRRRDRLPG